MPPAVLFEVVRSPTRCNLKIFVLLFGRCFVVTISLMANNYRVGGTSQQVHDGNTAECVLPTTARSEESASFKQQKEEEETQAYRKHRSHKSAAYYSQQTWSILEEFVFFVITKDASFCSDPGMPFFRSAILLGGSRQIRQATCCTSSLSICSSRATRSDGDSSLPSSNSYHLNSFVCKHNQ